MPAQSMPTLPYSNDLALRRSRWRRRLRRLLLLAIVIVIGWWLVMRTMPRVSLLYWQRQCAIYNFSGTAWNDNLKTISAQQIRDDYTLRVDTGDRTYDGVYPRSWERFTLALCDAGYPLPMSKWDISGQIVFLHQRTSSGGARRIICAELLSPLVARPDSTAICCAAITPATLVSPPAVAFSEAPLPGWYGGIEMDRLKMASADPADPSHFVLEYDHREPSANTFWAPNGLASDGIHPFDDMSHPRHYIVDGWLRDDGTLRFHLHTPDPNWP